MLYSVFNILSFYCIYQFNIKLCVYVYRYIGVTHYYTYMIIFYSTIYSTYSVYDSCMSNNAYRQFIIRIDSSIHRLSTRFDMLFFDSKYSYTDKRKWLCFYNIFINVIHLFLTNNINSSYDSRI